MSNISLPAPIGALDISAWEPPAVTGFPLAMRYFVGTKRVVHVEHRYTPDVEVVIDGLQNSRGEIERQIVCDSLHFDGPLTPAQAREVAAALLAPAHEVQRSIQ